MTTLKEKLRTLEDELVLGAVCAPCRFGSLDSFIETVLNRARACRVVDLDPISAIEWLARDFALEDVDTMPVGRLVASDLRLIAAALRRPSTHTLPGADAALDQIVDQMALLGISPRVRPVVNIVERFPRPYEDAHWSAMAPDEDDLAEYGIDPGVYFLRSRAKPVLLQCTLAHELLHFVPRDIMPGTFGMGIEEGICDLLGFLHIGAALVGEEAASRAFVYYRLLDGTPHLRKLYVHHDRLALSLLSELGLKELAMRLQTGRPKLRELEADCVAGSLLGRVGSESDQASRRLIERADWVLNRYLPSQILPPLCYILLEDLVRGVDVRELARKRGLPVEATLTSVRRASEQSQLFLMEDSTVVGYSNVATYVSASDSSRIPSIRYEVS